PGRTARACVLYSRPDECLADGAPAKACAREDAGDRPDRRVGRVLVAVLPGDGAVAEARKLRSGLDGAPSGRVTVEVGHQTAGLRGAGIAAAGLVAKARLTLFYRLVGEVLEPLQLVALAPAARGGPARAEDRGQVVPRGLVGRSDLEDGDRR